MADYDSDESNVEFLIQHMPLADVLEFVHARDEVRRIPAPPLARDENDDMLSPPSRPTMPAAVGRVVSALVEVEASSSQERLVEALVEAIIRANLAQSAESAVAA